MYEVNSLARELKGVFNWHQARTTNLSLVAHAFSGNAQPSQTIKRLQRFLRHVEIDYTTYAQIAAQWFCP